jgi:hypothetical protein
MFRYVLSLTFAVGLVSAATISTVAQCDGTTIFGTFSASCNHLGFEAHSSIEISPTFSVFAEASLQPPNTPGDAGAAASANFSDDYFFTVFGGTGDGYFRPCFVGSSGGSGISATMSFGGMAFDVTPVSQNPTNCLSSPFFPVNFYRPFTFGVPQVVHVTMLGSARPGPSIFPGMVSESLDHILFADTSGNPLSNITFTLVEVPEPSAVSLLGVGSMFLLVVAMIGRVAG